MLVLGENIHMKEQTYSLQRLSLAAIEWGASDGEIVLAIHGWLDNAASFIPVAEHLNLENKRLIAIDLPGHGLSDHRPKGESYHFLEYVQDIVELIHVFNRPVTLLGHSLGGAIASVVSAVIPEKVTRLVMLDALGPMTAKEEQTLANLRHAIDYVSAQREHKVKVIASLEQATRIRMTGMTALKSSSARLLVERSLIPCDNGFKWRSDARLKAPSLSRLTEGQVKNLFEGIECPVCVIAAEDGLFKFDKAPQVRFSYLRYVALHTVTGGHHFHMDGDVAEAAILINQFLSDVDGYDESAQSKAEA